VYACTCIASAAERRAQATAGGCRCCRKRLLSVGVSCPADRSAANPPAAVTATVCRSMGQTDRRTTDRYIHPALSIEEDRTKVRKFVVWMYGFWDMWAGTWTDIHTVIIMIAWWHSNALHSLYFFIFYKNCFWILQLHLRCPLERQTYFSGRYLNYFGNYRWYRSRVDWRTFHSPAGVRNIAICVCMVVRLSRISRV